MSRNSWLSKIPGLVEPSPEDPSTPPNAPGASESTGGSPTRFGAGLQKPAPAVQETDAFADMFNAPAPSVIDHSKPAASPAAAVVNRAEPAPAERQRPAVDKDMLEKLRSKVVAGEAGDIVTKFLGAMNELREDIQDPGRLFKATLRALSRVGISDTQVVAALRSVNSAILEHRSKFASASESRKAAESKATQDRVQGIEDELAQIDQNIRKLQQQQQTAQRGLREAEQQLEQIEGQYTAQSDQYNGASAELEDEFAQLLRLAGAGK